MGTTSMNEKEKKIISNFAKILPNISEKDKEYLLGVGEGFKLAKRSKRPTSKDKE
ncbi:hypothetical protein [Emergencia timonensis]|uniref:hypothetical protein n=1 Tax=Emergencia timonensis TaxID=1776384 RepID=UPI0039F46F4E